MVGLILQTNKGLFWSH